MHFQFLFQKLTGQELIYTEFLGKPYLTSYQYAEYCLNQNNRVIEKSFNHTVLNLVFIYIKKNSL